MMGPEQVKEGLEVGIFNDPEGHTIGLVRMTGEKAQDTQIDTELPADHGKPLEEVEDEDHRDEPTEMQDGGE